MTAFIRDALNAAVSAAWPYTGITLPNERAEPPADGSAWLALSYPVLTETMMTVGAPGANLWRQEGGLRVALFVPIGSGIDSPGAPWDSRIDDLRAALRGKVFGPVTTFEASPPITDNTNDMGAYYELSFVVVFQADVIG